MSFDAIARRATQDVLENIPVAEPWLSRWCILHMLHSAAIAAQDYRSAMRLAEQRYATWMNYRKMLGRA